jgi:GWxTD domain-containing protein
MGRRIKIVLLFFIPACAIPAFAGNPTAFITFASFSNPHGQNYFETYISVVGSSLTFVKNANNKYVAKAHVTISFKLRDSTVASANFNVLSPEVNDTSVKPNFINAHRFQLEKGNYSMAFTLDDPNDATHKIVTGTQQVHVGYPDTVSVSDAEFLTSATPSNKPGPYNKCGYDMIPYVYSNYFQASKKLSFYCEIYNTIKYTGPGQKITVKYSIEEDGAYDLALNNNFMSSAKLNADTVVPFMAEVPIDNLPTGSYHISVSVLDKNSHQLAKRNFSFTKDNPGVKSKNIPAGFAVYMANKDTLIESIHCLAPISGISERSYVTGDSLQWVPMPELKRYFYYFWLSRDSVNPLQAWQKYLDKVMAVDNSFDMKGLKGYRTDRGRIYLQYGAPSHRIVETNNPATYPHEIWEYYRFPDGQTDVKFVFYTTAIETNNYELLHSTASGEVQNPQWQLVLYSRFGTPGSVDAQLVQDQQGEDLNDEFNNPH